MAGGPSGRNQPARPRPARPSSTAPVVSLVVIGTVPEAVRAALGDAAGGWVWFLSDPADLPDPDPATAPELVLAVHPLDADVEHETAVAWARAAGVPALSLALEPDATLVGPLTIPNRPGCGQCGRRRMRAASAGRAGLAPARRHERTDPAVASVDEVRVGTRTTLIRHLAAAAQAGGAGSPLLDHVLAVDTGTGLETLHRVVPVPWCPVCGGPPARTGPGRTDPLSADDEPGIVLEALAGWVDARTGVIPALVLEQPAAAAPGLPLVATAAPPHTVEPDGSLRVLPIGWGKGLTLAGAVVSAVGEAVERYAPNIADTDRLVWARPAELTGDRLDPRDVPLYTDDQYRRADFPFAPFDADVAHPWVAGWWLDGGAPVWVPAVLAFLSLDLRPEQAVCQGTSNGLAASTDLDDAARRASMELVERDAFMAAWLTGRPGRRVLLDHGLDPALAGVLDGIEALGGRVELYVLPTSAVGTTAVCLALGDGERWPGVAIGLGADLDPVRAVGQSVLELGQTGPHLRRLMRSGEVRPPAEPAEVRSMLDHAAYYFAADRADAFDRLRHGGRPVTLSALARAAGAGRVGWVAALRLAAVRVALVDVSSRDVSTGPFRVVRAVSPDLQPISFGHGLDRVPVPRLRPALATAPPPPPVHPIW